MAGSAWGQEIHERLLRGDPTAPAQLVDDVLGWVVQALERRFPGLVDPTMVGDAATDAIIGYVKHPDRFDPTRRGLRGYLLMSAEGDLRNALAKAGRRPATEDVELLAAAGKIRIEAPDVVAEIDAERRREDLNRLFEEPRDRAMVALILDGERSTEAFASILGVQDLPIEAQRTEVKRHKDRLKKRLREYGRRIGGSEQG